MFFAFIPLIFVPDWRFDSDGIWISRRGDQLLVSDVPKGYPRSQSVQRLLRFHAIHPQSRAYIASDRGLCYWVRKDRTVISGFTSGHWAVGDFATKDWRRSLSKFDLHDVSILAKLSASVSFQKAENSQWRLPSGLTVKLPVGWFWLDEALGLSPVNTPSDLCNASLTSPIRTYQFRPEKKTSINRWLAYQGFSNQLISKGFEHNKVRNMAGFCVRMDGNLVFLCSRNLTDIEKRMVETLCSAIVTR